MGAYCSSGDSQTLAFGEFKISVSTHRVVRLQAWARGFLARLRLRNMRQLKVKSVVSKLLLHKYIFRAGVVGGSRCSE